MDSEATEGDVFRTLTLLVAVCESAMGVLERVVPERSVTLASVTSLRDHAADVLLRDFARHALARPA